MNIPLNGRIAIVDDVYAQAEPLMRILSKNQIPYTYYKGTDARFLPEKDARYNDIRLLFLDINLLDDTAVPNEKQIRSSLLFTLERILSPENFPYSIIFWSRHQVEHSSIIEDIFNNELSDRKPILFQGFVKSDFFPNYSSEEVDNTIDLLATIETIINEQEAYSNLLHWENNIHLSADQTLQNLFSSFNGDEWINNSNYTLSKLGQAYLGKHYIDANNEAKIKGSYISLSTVFKDTLEHNLQNQALTNAPSLEYTDTAALKSVNSINSSLNTVNYVKEITESGNVLEFTGTGSVPDNPYFKNLLFGILSRSNTTNIIKESNRDLSEGDLKRLASKEFKKKRKEIEKHCRPVCIVVTPVCDFAQKKSVYDRIVKGLLIPKEYHDYIENKSEAVFTVPFVIEIEGKEYYLVLDFRYFATTHLAPENVNGLLRVRQELLAEIQSKLSRHINRQGILIIDER